MRKSFIHSFYRMRKEFIFKMLASFENNKLNWTGFYCPFEINGIIILLNDSSAPPLLLLFKIWTPPIMGYAGRFIFLWI